VGVPGPPAKLHRRNRTPLVHTWVEIPNTPNTSGPRLPSRRRNGAPWPAFARARWNSWRAMPHARLWQSSDWQFALDSIELVARTADGDDAPVALLSEIRLRKRVMGCTWDARQSMRLRCTALTTDEDTAPGSVARLDEYRNL
jgi:hypothetical protein